MRKTQAIFRAVLRAGYYGPDRYRSHQSPYMCAALGMAHRTQLAGQFGNPEVDLYTRNVVVKVHSYRNI